MGCHDKHVISHNQNCFIDEKHIFFHSNGLTEPSALIRNSPRVQFWSNSMFCPRYLIFISIQAFMNISFTLQAEKDPIKYEWPQHYSHYKFCFLIVLMLNVSVNNFPVMSGRSHRFLGITSTFRGVNVSLLKDTTRRRWVSNPRPLAPESANYK